MVMSPPHPLRYLLLIVRPYLHQLLIPFLSLNILDGAEEQVYDYMYVPGPELETMLQYMAQSSD